MRREYSIYCDESCHLENDGQPVMVLGAVWCPTSKRREIFKRIREIKEKNGISDNIEMKWTKVSDSKMSAYVDLVDYFFDDDDLHFRALIVADKNNLRHEDFGQTHNDWYYKMYFDMLKSIISNEAVYNIYIDIKDSVGGEKIERLKEVLSNEKYDFNREIIKRMQLVRSDEIEIMQIVDILSGATMAANRNSTTSSSKNKIISRIRERSGYSLTKTTLLTEAKFYTLVWNGQNLQ